MRNQDAFLRNTLPAIGMCAILAGCTANSLFKKPEQGLSGAFLTYAPPENTAECSPHKTWAAMDSCRRENERLIEEPYRGSLTIRNLYTGQEVEQPLDEMGGYRVALIPGTYAVCLAGECSDPIVVTIGSFSTYGQRLPRASDGPSSVEKTELGAAGDSTAEEPSPEAGAEKVPSAVAGQKEDSTKVGAVDEASKQVEEAGEPAPQLGVVEEANDL